MFSFFVIVVLTFSNVSSQNLLSPTGRDCGSTYNYTSAYFANDCVSGYFGDVYYDLDFRCSCLCNTPWNYKFNHVCKEPRYHRITCGFGGPRWFVNCWNPSVSEYRQYESLMRFAHKKLPINIKFNQTSKDLVLTYYISHGSALSSEPGVLKNFHLNLNTFHSNSLP
ncbi:hypothetical protein [Astegopteryx formosana nege-like virus 1]|nr:hypothetical protein [Astegopteryx formosana nege-like virus 1]